MHFLLTFVCLGFIELFSQLHNNSYVETNAVFKLTNLFCCCYGCAWTFNTPYFVHFVYLVVYEFFPKFLYVFDITDCFI